MAARLVTAADAVVTRINDGSPYTIGAVAATRKYVPRYERTSAGTLQVVVLPRGDVRDPASRAGWREDFYCDVGVYKSVTVNNEVSDVDDLLLLVEELKDRVQFQTYGDNTWLRTEGVPADDPAWHDADLKDLHVLLVTFRLVLRAFRR
jgi:hypothetical protein